jgi:hypothetical protein
MCDPAMRLIQWKGYKHRWLYSNNKTSQHYHMEMLFSQTTKILVDKQQVQ